MYVGVIADDFTGGTDIAGFLVQNGLSVIQFLDVPDMSFSFGKQNAAVISLKSRSCPVTEAVQDSLAALRWLQTQGCEQFIFKYCSTFDSTPKGNIGPVTDALLDALGADITVMAPALPVNGRTVYFGYLFVNGVPLNESGMEKHPVTPMLDSNLMRLTEAQSFGKAANIPASVIELGVPAIRKALEELRVKGVSYAVPDALNDDHLTALGEAVEDLLLVTGGSGLGAGIARRIAAKYGLDGIRSVQAGYPPGGKCVVISGSASVMTNVQIARYRNKALSMQVDVRRAVTEGDAFAEKLAAWVAGLPAGGSAPLLYSTIGAEELAVVQKKFGAEASGHAVETLFAKLATLLKDEGFDHFIVAGGETSGSVVKALGIKAFHIGPQIAPGVPWVRATDQPISLALKSGNFGGEDFFFDAQEFFK
jgi:uncharacterized protein YgbK (DUF1537 family)